MLLLLLLALVMKRSGELQVFETCIAQMYRYRLRALGLIKEAAKESRQPTPCMGPHSCAVPGTLYTRIRPINDSTRDAQFCYDNPGLVDSGRLGARDGCIALHLRLTVIRAAPGPSSSARPVSVLRGRGRS